METPKERTYLCIDGKCFYASIECAERGLNPFETNLVVADPARGKNALCLAISPHLKSLGVHNRCRLSDIPGISRKKAAEISEAFREQAGIRELMVFCQNYIGSTSISHIYEKWGNRAVGVIRENPYILCEETDTIGF